MGSARRREHLASRLQGFGTTVFATMSALAVQHDAANLGQGFPDDGTPPELVRLAADAMAAGHNQYAPGRGVPTLRTAIAAHQRRHHAMTLDPDREVLVTAGATEGMYAALASLCEVGDEVLALEPTYDAYRAGAAMAGARLVGVPLALTDRGYALDVDRLRASVSARTRLLVVNSPHNPTGLVLTAEERAAVADVAVGNDLLVVTDEVYEHLTYDEQHVPLATLPGMRERTLTISSAGKSYAVTGWKVGWATGPPELVDAVMTAKQWVTFVNGTPFQHALAGYLALDDGAVAEAHLGDQRERFRTRRDRLSSGLADVGLTPLPAPGGYFVVADAAPVGITDGMDACLRMPEALGVAAIPVQAFHEPGTPGHTDAAPLLRFAFCKDETTIDTALDRLNAETLSDLAD